MLKQLNNDCNERVHSRIYELLCNYMRVYKINFENYIAEMHAYGSALIDCDI